jgi:hypothetical protein
MASGELYVLDSWVLTPDGKALEGAGTRYTPQREPGETGRHHLPLEAIALVETNDRRTVGSLGTAGLGILTIAFGVLAVVCTADPKSCFGSCPTFYVDGDAEVPRAEAFSSSILRALEATDVDALPRPRPGARRLGLTMRNEALETHYVRSVRLLAAPRPEGGDVLATPDGRFFAATGMVAPATCRGPRDDCLEQVVRLDRRERFSEADPGDLATRETLELRFPPASGPVGLVVSARQGLVTTFVYYQTLAYLGRQAGDWLADAERGGPERARAAMGMARALGGIDAEVAEGTGEWRPIGAFEESGPIAGDTQVLPFEAHGGPLRVRLRLAKGNWRIDRLSLARLGGQVTPRAIEPDRVERGGVPDPGALAALRDERHYLVALPGDARRIEFALPRDLAAPELFLESRGYYYEWMREEWLGEEDPAMAALLFARPDEGLRLLAGAYKAHEPTAERSFWRSRFGR